MAGRLQPLDLRLQLAHLCERVQRLAAVRFGLGGQPVRSRSQILRNLFSFLGPRPQGDELRPKASVRLLETRGSASLGAQLMPQGEWLIEVSSEAFPVGALALSLGRPLAGSAYRAPTGFRSLSLHGCPVADHVVHHIRTGRNSVHHEW